MGIIQRQVIKNNIISLLAVTVGAVAMLFIYPMDGMETKGYADGVLKIVRLLSPFFLLGGTSVMVRYLPYVDRERSEAAAALFTRALLVVGITAGAAVSVLLLFQKRPLLWVDENITSLGYLASEPWTVLALLVCIALSSILTANLTNHRRIAIPVIFNSLLPKIGLPLLFLYILYSGGDRREFTTGLIFIYSLTVTGLSIYTRLITKNRLTLTSLNLNPKRLKQLYALAGFSVIGSIGSVLSTHLDTFFVSTYLGDAPTGIYSFAVFAAMVMFIPSQAINAITSPIVASCWKEKDFAHINFLYKESAAVLFAAGGLIYVGALVCLPSLFQLTENSTVLTSSFTVFVFLGAAQLLDLLTSINGTIISNSDYFRWNMIFVVILGVINVCLNYYFVLGLKMGMEGAALATLCSLFIYNASKLAFIKVKMNMLPFSSSLVYTSVVLLGTWVSVNSLPHLEYPIFDILLRGTLVVSIFFLYLRFTNGVPPIRQFLASGRGSLFNRG